jgi:hypothetical protein
MSHWKVIKRELTEVGDDDICTVRSEVDGVIASSNANHKSEPAGTPCFHADDGVFEDDGASRWSPEPPGRFQEHVRRRLARKTEPSKIDAIYANVKELGEACRIEHRRTVLRR